MAKKPTKNAPLLENPKDRHNWREIQFLQPFLFRYSFDPQDLDRVGMLIPGAYVSGSRYDGAVMLSWSTTDTNESLSFQPLGELRNGAQVEFFRYLYENEHVEIYGSQREANQGEGEAIAATFQAEPSPARVDWLQAVRADPTNLSLVPPGVVFRALKLSGVGEGEESMAVIGPSRTNAGKPGAANVVNLYSDRRSYRVLTMARMEANANYRFVDVVQVTTPDQVNQHLRHALVEAVPQVRGLPVHRWLEPIPADHPIHRSLAEDPLALELIPYGVPFWVNSQYRNTSTLYQAVRCRADTTGETAYNEDHLRMVEAGRDVSSVRHLGWQPLHGRNQNGHSFSFVSFLPEREVNRHLLSLCNMSERVLDPSEAEGRVYVDPDIESAAKVLEANPQSIDAIPNGVPYFRKVPPNGDTESLLCVNVESSPVSHNRHILIAGNNWNGLESRTKKNWVFDRFATSQDLETKTARLDERFTRAVKRCADLAPTPAEAGSTKKPVKPKARKKSTS